MRTLFLPIPSDRGYKVLEVIPYHCVRIHNGQYVDFLYYVIPLKSPDVPDIKDRAELMDSVVNLFRGVVRDEYATWPIIVGFTDDWAKIPQGTK